MIKVWVELALNTKNVYLVETYFTFLFLKLQSSHMSRKKLKIPINIPTNLLIGSSDFFNSKMKALLNSSHHKWLQFLRHFICLCSDMVIITISFAARTYQSKLYLVVYVIYKKNRIWITIIRQICEISCMSDNIKTSNLGNKVYITDKSVANTWRFFH